MLKETFRPCRRIVCHQRRFEGSVVISALKVGKTLFNDLGVIIDDVKDLAPLLVMFGFYWFLEV